MISNPINSFPIFTEKLLSYSIPKGVQRGLEVDLSDQTYDGRDEGDQLVGGLGQLVDGQRGTDNFRSDIHGFGKGRQKYFVLKIYYAWKFYGMKLPLCIECKINCLSNTKLTGWKLDGYLHRTEYSVLSRDFSTTSKYRYLFNHLISIPYKIALSNTAFQPTFIENTRLMCTQAKTVLNATTNTVASFKYSVGNIFDMFFIIYLYVLWVYTFWNIYKPLLNIPSDAKYYSVHCLRTLIFTMTNIYK